MGDIAGRLAKDLEQALGPGVLVLDNVGKEYLSVAVGHAVERTILMVIGTPEQKAGILAPGLQTINIMPALPKVTWPCEGGPLDGRTIERSIGAHRTYCDTMSEDKKSIIETTYEKFPVPESDARFVWRVVEKRILPLDMERL